MNNPLSAAADPANPSSAVYFIDATLPDLHTLLAGLPLGADVQLIPAGQDGLQFMVDALAGRSGLGALHILSHGASGALQLGIATLNAATLASRAADLALIGQSLNGDGDILLYGCNVAASEVGAQFVGTLAQATGADVAASDDLTGAQALGGDWELEFASGDVEAAATLDTQAQQAYAFVMAKPRNGTTTFDGSNSSPFFGASPFTTVNVGGSGWDISATEGVLDTNTYVSAIQASDQLDFYAYGQKPGSETLANGWIKANDGSDFRLISFKAKYDNKIIGDVQLTLLEIQGYKDGTAVSGTSTSLTLTPIYQTFSFYAINASYAVIDEIRWTVTNGNFSSLKIDDLAISTDPYVSSVSVPTNGTYAGGQHLDFTVNFSEAATVVANSGTPRLALNIGGDIKYATYLSGSGTTAAVFRYTLESGLQDLDGIGVTSLQANGGTITNAGSANMALALNWVGSTASVNVNSINSAPTLTANGSSLTFTEDGSAVSLFASASASTVDSGQTFSGLTLTVTNVADGASEILSIGGTLVSLVATDASPITINGGGSAAVTLSGGTATVVITGMTRDSTALQTLVNGISYSNISHNPTTASNRVVTLIEAKDSGGAVNGGVDTCVLSLASTVSITAVNDAPTITGVPGTAQSATFGTAITLADFTVADPDGASVDLSSVPTFFRGERSDLARNPPLNFSRVA